ncbi:Glucocorticoid-induced transcript 1 protein [Liparis tanakae]|uniref:Glucocorticoid-induced transcript 1 protein n=1 Tax=Liparis tanakae TaxID=230148 RepID=A0A4Z2G9F7_9TELE|nr:Glucocorticoid-induced transcript 1 protein [Liparis tanakae]
MSAPSNSLQQPRVRRSNAGSPGSFSGGGGGGGSGNGNGNSCRLHPIRATVPYQLLRGGPGSPTRAQTLHGGAASSRGSSPPSSPSLGAGSAKHGLSPENKDSSCPPDSPVPRALGVDFPPQRHATHTSVLCKRRPLTRAKRLALVAVMTEAPPALRRPDLTVQTRRRRHPMTTASASMHAERSKLQVRSSSAIRRTSSLDAITGPYLTGQWPRDSHGPYPSCMKDKATQRRREKRLRPTTEGHVI